MIVEPSLDYEVIPSRFLNLILQSAFIPNTQILSTLLIARAGLGKTSILQKIKKLDFVEYTVDMTPKGIVEFLKDVDGKGKKFLVLPDYIATLGHSKKTKDLSRTFFRAMMEEGIKDNSAFGMELHLRKEVHAGLISSITPEFYESNMHVWRVDGFLSRFLPFSFSHSPTTERLIIEDILNKTNHKIDYDFKIRTDNVTEPKKTEAISTKIELLSFRIKDRNATPYRPLRQMISLCNANAVLRDSDYVEDIDINEVTEICKFINKEQNPL